MRVPSVIDRLRAQVAARDLSVVLPEGEDARVASAARQIAAEGWARVILGGAEAPGCTPMPAADDALVGRLADRRPRLGVQGAARLLARPVPRAAALVADGRADAVLAGAVTTTRRVVEAGLMVIGPAPGIAVASSFFLMLWPDGRAMIFADCAVTVAPDAEALAAIAVSSARTAEALLGEARTALLSYSTGASGTGPEVETVRRAASLAQTLAPDLDVDGPLQADAALSPRVAKLKGARGAVAGRANVLVFPGLAAGNIAYKLATELGGVQAIGPILQGFARPISDVSRGATVDDIVCAALVTLALS